MKKSQACARGERWLSDEAAVLCAWCAWCAWCAHPAATEEAALVALAEHTTMLTDAVGGLSTLMADRVLVREGQRIAAELALLEQRLHVRSPSH